MTPQATALSERTPPSLPSLTEHWIESLNDGSHVVILPLQAQDRERELRFIKRLSPEARRARFLCAFNQPHRFEQMEPCSKTGE